jgi:hypothetical protein
VACTKYIQEPSTTSSVTVENGKPARAQRRPPAQAKRQRRTHSYALAGPSTAAPPPPTANMPTDRDIELNILNLKEDSFGQGSNWSTSNFTTPREPAYESHRPGRFARFVDSFKRDPRVVAPSRAARDRLSFGLGEEPYRDDDGDTDEASHHDNRGIRHFDIKAANLSTASTALARELKGRHLQMIAIGGSIGTLLRLRSFVSFFSFCRQRTDVEVHKTDCSVCLFGCHPNCPHGSCGLPCTAGARHAEAERTSSPVVCRGLIPISLQERAFSLHRARHSTRAGQPLCCSRMPSLVPCSIARCKLSENLRLLFQWRAHSRHSRLGFLTRPGVSRWDGSESSPGEFQLIGCLSNCDAVMRCNGSWSYR